MSKQRKGLVPELRFSGFSEPWEVKALAPYLKQHCKKVPSSTELDVFSSTREGLKSQNEYFDGSNLANDGEYGVVPEGYFVYRHMSDDNIFKFNINKSGKQIAVSKEYPVFKTQSLDPGFLLNVLNEGRAFRAFAASQKKGGTRTRLYFKTLCTFELPLPSPKEQQKIADCLASIDELIALHTQKLEALKDYKKGLMQQFFPTEGETMPKLRFPGFREKGAWNIYPLGSVGENLDFKRVPITEKDRVKGDFPYYGASGVIDYVNDYIFDEKLLCISEDGANLRARTYPIAFSITGKTWVNNHAHVIRFEHKSTQTLVENYLNSVSLEDYLTGMAQPKLNRAKLDIIPIPLPSIEEQDVIADLLNSLDELVIHQASTVENLAKYKSGLVQNLFPVMDEVN
ncbi:restriction endonuclease subunit S [Pantoea ananatis]|uniref:restriction endonuclease subunit S n=1 Tax=Pantoea ananas TaxID=553 RepID=UPI000A81A79A|nr:restriction endonuclease subunit S [Pantoea ananatis]